MTRYLSEEDRAFRALVIELDGNQEAIAARLGIGRPSVSMRLRADKHAAFWRAFKKARAKRKRAARQRRWAERARKGLVGTPPTR